MPQDRALYLLDPSLGRVLWDPSVPGTGFYRERAKADIQVWLKELTPCSF